LSGERDEAAAPSPTEALEETVEELYEDAPCGYLTTDPDGLILRANRTFLGWCGYTRDELVGQRRLTDLLPPGGRIYHETHYAPLLRMQQEVRELALEVLRADGSRLPVLVNASLKVDEAERPVLVRVTLFDASQRRRYEEELLQARAAAEEQAAAATALVHVAEAVVLVDDDGLVRVANAAAGRLLGVEPGAAVGRPLAELVPGWGSLAPRIPVTRDGAGAAVLLPLALGGGTRWVRATAERAPAGVVFTLRDVTDERRLDELRDDIVAVVSHELRTPLAGVLGAAQTLTASGDRLDDETRGSLVAMIGEQSARLARILDQMLLTQSLDAGDLVLSRGTFDAGEAAGRAVDVVRRRAPDARIELEPAAHVETAAEGDAGAYEQVVVNLLDNALKYGAGTPVRLRVEQSRGSVRLVVADTGPGIAPGDRERVFEKFLRLESGEAAGGTGLGLYISRELVRRMRGRIGILDSESGAAFFVDVPAARA